MPDQFAVRPNQRNGLKSTYFYLHAVSPEPCI